MDQVQYSNLNRGSANRDAQLAEFESFFTEYQAELDREERESLHGTAEAMRVAASNAAALALDDIVD